MSRELVLSPLVVSFSAAIKSGVVRTQLEGGTSKYRRDIIGNMSLANVTWVGPIEDYEYLRAFYRAATLNGSEPFDIRLKAIGTTETLYEGVYFVPGSFSGPTKQGDVYSISAQLALSLE